MKFIVNNKEVEFNSVEALFRAKRSQRNELFGQYITSVGQNEKANLEDILKLAKAKQEECKQWQSNLETLVNHLEEAIKEANDAKLEEAVNAMDAEHLAKFKKLIDEKVKQQQ